MGQDFRANPGSYSTAIGLAPDQSPALVSTKGQVLVACEKVLFSPTAAWCTFHQQAAALTLIV